MKIDPETEVETTVPKPVPPPSFKVPLPSPHFGPKAHHRPGAVGNFVGGEDDGRLPPSKKED